MRIIIGADVVPTKSNEVLFSSGNIEELFGEKLVNLFKSSDVNIVDLETPFSVVTNPINKIGPNFNAKQETINAIKKLGVNVAAIGNNHILDQGQEGLLSTMQLLTEAAIPFVGAGKRIEEARQPLIIEKENKIISIYNCVENEFSIASEKSAGANPYDPLYCYDEVEKLKAKSDYVIVLYHGGKEYYRYPSPMLQKRCRRFVEKGADIVVCQHSHCIGCQERYLEKSIIYGQGNFIFDNSNDECWQTGLLIQIDDLKEIKFIPLEKQKNTVRMAESSKSQEILKQFEARSSNLLKNEFISKQYKELADEASEGYLVNLLCLRNSRLLRLINRLFGYKLFPLLLRKRITKESALIYLNYLECEAHRELLLEGVKNIIRNAE